MKKKTEPKDYPIFAFRVSGTEKSQLSADIEFAVDQLNKNRADDEKMWRKNDVIVEALKIGLSTLKKKRQR